MRRDIIELRQVVQKLVPMLTGKGLKVTQRGSQAFVRTDVRTGKPTLVNIPNIPDNATPEFVAAIQGFIDHEVSHVLNTDWDWMPGRCKEDGKRSDSEKQRLHNIWNIIEDTFIEREIVREFPGSRKNLENVRKHFLSAITEPAIASANGDPQKEFSYLMVPMMRALAGHEEMVEWMDANGYWQHPLVKGLLDQLSQDFLDTLPKIDCTEQSYWLARELEDILHKQEPPAPPMQQPQNGGSDDQDQDDESDGESQDKPEQEAGEGDGDGERDHQDSDADEEAEDGSGASGDEEENDDAGEDDTDQSGDDEDQDSEEDGSGSDDEGDDAEDGDAEADEEDADGSSSGGDGSEDEDADQDEACDADADGDDGDGGSGSDEAGESGKDDGSEGKAGSSGDNQVEDIAADESDGEGGNDYGEERQDGGGVGSGEGKSIFEFMEDDALDAADLSNAMQVLITEQAVDDIRRSDYSVFTKEMDQIEPITPPPGMRQEWVTEMDDEVRAMTGQMQKDIERMLASQSHVVRTPGHRRGKLHAPSLHRVIQGDPRVFTQREENRSKDTAVTLLCDNSGSMSGAKMHLAMIAAYALATTLERVKITHEVLGFTTGGLGHFPRSVQEAYRDEVDRGVDYDRIVPIVMPIYKSFDERITSDVKKRFAYMMNAQPGLNTNIDGESLEYAAERLVKRTEQRKVIIVMSDGMPAGAREAGPHLKAVVKDLNASGIDTIGIGIMSDAVRRFYERATVLDNLQELPTQVMQELKALLG